ncbi:MAG TPA: oligosaccharide flippase family protein [Minicystis sp.]|nr:oligosaccharide flippase family protein [Minicystis sp.]
MAIPKKAVLGALWSISTGFGARAVTLAATLLITRFLSPEVYGEVSLASVIVLTAHTASSFGLGQYVVAKQTPRGVTAQATWLYVAIGLVAFGLIVLVREPLSAFFGTPGSAQYLPWLAVAAALDRVAFMPERVMYRDMRFRTASIARSLGEVVFGVGCVAFAAAGYGGDAIVIGTFMRSILKLGIDLVVVDRREWLAPPRLERAQVRDFFRFGVPLTIASISEFGSRRWDNLLMSRLFGPAVAGMYNYAYNLADIPATQIGESIGDVLVPSFAEMDAPRRKAALLRSITLVTLIVGPLALGLGAVAPTLVRSVFDARWEPMWRMLAILSVLSVVRPVAWIVAPYLQVYDKPGTMMRLEVSKTALLLVSIVVLGRIGGPLLACAAPGVAFSVNAVANLFVVRQMEGVPVRRTLGPLVPPLLACAPMVAAVVAVRHLLAAAGHLPRFAGLGIEVTSGAIAFVASAFVIARAATRDLLGLLRGAARRGRPAAPPDPEAPEPAEQEEAA